MVTVSSPAATSWNKEFPPLSFDFVQPLLLPTIKETALGIIGLRLYIRRGQ